MEPTLEAPASGQQIPSDRGKCVRPLGFEPRTCGLRVRCSAIELEAPDTVKLAADDKRNCLPQLVRVTDGVRTRDLRGHIPAL